MFKDITYFEADATDLEDLICRAYELDKFIIDRLDQRSNEQNYIVYYVGDKKKNSEIRIIDDFLERKYCKSHEIRYILDDLHKKGLIEEGSYLIDLRH